MPINNLENNLYKDLQKSVELDKYCQFCASYSCQFCSQRENNKPPSEFRLEFCCGRESLGEYYVKLDFSKYVFTNDNTFEQALNSISQEVGEDYQLFKPIHQSNFKVYYVCKEFSFITNYDFLYEISEWRDRQIISRDKEHRLILFLNHIFSYLANYYEFEDVKQKKLKFLELKNQSSLRNQCETTDDSIDTEYLIEGGFNLD